MDFVSVPFLLFTRGSTECYDSILADPTRALSVFSVLAVPIC